MTKLPVTIIGSLVLMVTTIFIPKLKTFNGEIMDSQCGEMGQHGVLNPLRTAKDCTIDCVRFGGRYVLYDGSIQVAYGLDDQRKPEPFAGDRVQVTGTLDKLTHTIHVTDIRSASDGIQAHR